MLLYVRRSILPAAVVGCLALGALPGGAGAATATGGGLAVPDGGSAAASGGLNPDSPARGNAGPAAGALPSAGLRDVPPAYLRLYRLAAGRAGLDWRLLAAIGKNESDHGRTAARGVRSGVNYARCCAGPMQICVVASCGRVWQRYAADGDGDGRRSVYDPADAIFAAARLLVDLRAAVGSRPDFLLASYNAGPAHVVRYHELPRNPETRAYVRSGLRYMRLLSAR